MGSEPLRSRSAGILELGSRLNKSYPIGEGGDETERRKEILSELVVARGDATPILEPAEATFDNVAIFVGFLVVADFLLAVGFAGNDGLDTALFEEGSDRIGVIAFVSEKFFNAGDEAHAFFRHHTIGGISGRENEGPGPAEFVDYRMDLAVAAAFRKADRLKIGPPFPP
jgi:hypothetical protein